MDDLLASYASSDEEVASKEEEEEEEQEFHEGEFLSCVALPASMCDYVFFLYVGTYAGRLNRMNSWPIAWGSIHHFKCVVHTQIPPLVL